MLGKWVIEKNEQEIKVNFLRVIAISGPPCSQCRHPFGVHLSISNAEWVANTIQRQTCHLGFSLQQFRAGKKLRIFCFTAQLIFIFFCKFTQQEPGANATEILNGIKYMRPGGGFVPNFKLFQKTDVNGENSEPLYTYLRVIIHLTFSI
jgi:hypothetical protein